MKYEKDLNWYSLILTLFISLLLFPELATSQAHSEMSEDAKIGMDLFEGNTRLENGGPSCITCHNVTNEDVMPGGLYGKDLTDVYERFGIGLSSWLQAPDPPAMAASYNFNPLEENERENLSAFFKYAYETKDQQTANSGNMYLLGGGSIGLILLLLVVQLLWGNRKKKMVKADIFSRQNKAWDAKF